jgi:hypothetical protein
MSLVGCRQQPNQRPSDWHSTLAAESILLVSATAATMPMRGYYGASYEVGRILNQLLPMGFDAIQQRDLEIAERCCTHPCDSEYDSFSSFGSRMQIEFPPGIVRHRYALPFVSKPRQ